MSNWREIRGYTDRAVARIGKAEYERQRKWSEGMKTFTEGLSLWQKHQEGAAGQEALEQFGASEGLTYDKDTKAFYGTKVGYSEEGVEKDSQYYKITPAELKNMQNFQKFTDKSISDFISTKDDNVKKGYSVSEIPEQPKEGNESWFDRLFNKG